MLLVLETVCSQPELLPIMSIIKTILTVLQILIPIGLIILGTIDLGRAVIASKEDEIKKHQQLLLKRAIAAVLVFFVATLVVFVMGFVGNQKWKDCWNAQWECASGKINTITGECEK